jgi:hypothetical protein
MGIHDDDFIETLISASTMTCCVLIDPRKVYKTKGYKCLNTPPGEMISDHQLAEPGCNEKIRQSSTSTADRKTEIPVLHDPHGHRQTYVDTNTEHPQSGLRQST